MRVTRAIEHILRNIISFINTNVFHIQQYVQRIEKQYLITINVYGDFTLEKSITYAHCYELLINTYFL